jgi:antitoxin PrlF
VILEATMPSAILRRKGQITVPKEIREALKVDVGDRLDFVLEGPQRVVVRAGVANVEDLKGLLYRPGRRRVSLEQMTASVARRDTTKNIV